MKTSRIALTLCALTLADVFAGQSGGGFEPLFEGTFDGWTIENTTLGNFTIDGGVLKVEGTGGWLKSQRQYSDFELRAELRFLTEGGDSGIFVRAAPDGSFGAGWPNRSYQVQLLNPHIERPFPPIGHVFRHGMPPGDTALDLAAARRAFRGIGEWQLLEVDVAGSELTVRLNGVPLTRAANIANRTGYIGIQGETSALEFRRIEIREFGPSPAARG